MTILTCVPTRDGPGKKACFRLLVTGFSNCIWQGVASFVDSMLACPFNLQGDEASISSIFARSVPTSCADQPSEQICPWSGAAVRETVKPEKAGGRNEAVTSTGRAVTHTEARSRKRAKSVAFMTPQRSVIQYTMQKVTNRAPQSSQPSAISTKLHKPMLYTIHKPRLTTNRYTPKSSVMSHHAQLRLATTRTHPLPPPRQSSVICTQYTNQACDKRPPSLCDLAPPPPSPPPMRSRRTLTISISRVAASRTPPSLLRS